MALHTCGHITYVKLLSCNRCIMPCPSTQRCCRSCSKQCTLLLSRWFTTALANVLQHSGGARVQHSCGARCSVVISPEYERQQLQILSEDTL
jgi:hypothetical protein